MRRILLVVCLCPALTVVSCSVDEEPEAAMQPKTVQLESQKIAYYESEGTGHPVMLVHGNSSSGRAYRHQLDSELGRKYRMIAIDLPGHGASDRAEVMNYSIQYYARTVAEVATALQMEDAVFVGWSLGGHAVLQAQALLPDASGFVIFGTPPLTMPPAMEQAFLPHPAMAAAFKPELTQEEVEAFAAAFFAPASSVDTAPFVSGILVTDGNARAGLAANIAASFDAHRRGELADEVAVARSLGGALAILHGEQDQLVNGAYIASLEFPALWRGAVQRIPDAGHTPQWERPGQFNTLLGEFIEDVRQ